MGWAGGYDDDSTEPLRCTWLAGEVGGDTLDTADLAHFTDYPENHRRKRPVCTRMVYICLDSFAALDARKQLYPL